MESDFELCEPFGIDDGQLNGLSPQECFVLGYELALVHNLAESTGDDVQLTVHVDNKERIESALKRRGRRFSWAWPSDDVSEGWVYLKIKADAARDND